MKVYQLDPDKSKIKWSSQIGDQSIHGEFHGLDGNIVSDLGEITGGNISVDLKTITITDTALTGEQKDLIDQAIKKSPIIKGDDSVVNFKFEEIISNPDHDLIKGILMISNQAFGMDVVANFNQTDSELVARGKMDVQSSNPVLIQELDNLYDHELDEDKNINSFNIECELVASESE